MAEVEFRDAVREVPDHLADLMAGLDTYRMTYDEAVKEVNRLLQRRPVDTVFDDIIKSHFSEGVTR